MNALDLRLDDPKQSPSLSKSLHEKLQQKHNVKNNVVCRIDELGDDILSSILSRIDDSWQHLVQCRSVSKRWNNIISQPNFLGLIFSKLLPYTLYVKSRRKTYLISEHPYFQTQNINTPLFDLDFNDNDEEYKFSIVGSYSDLLIYKYHDQYFRPFKPLYYFIFNPITGKYIKIEIPVDYNNDGGNGCQAIGCAGNLEGITSILNKSDDEQRGFTFLRIIPNLFTHTFQLFSFESSEWITYCTTLKFDPRLSHFRSRNSVTLNNKMHWLLYDSILVIDPFSDDITRYRLIKLPQVRRSFTLGLCRGRLRLVYFEYKYRRFYKAATLNVWELEHDDDLIESNWVVVLDDDFKTSNWVIVCMKVVSMSLESVYPISLHPYDSDVVYVKNEDGIVRYNLKSGDFKVMLEHDHHIWIIHPLMNPVIDESTNLKQF